MNLNIITCAQNMRLSVKHKCGFVCMSHLRHSVAVTLSRVSGDQT